MKNLLLITFFLLSAIMVFGQAPQKMTYQAVIRDAGDALVTSSPIGMQISILQNSPTGTAVYVETQTPNSNVNGLVTIKVGEGAVISGDFSAIDW